MRFGRESALERGEEGVGKLWIEFFEPFHHALHVGPPRIVLVRALPFLPDEITLLCKKLKIAFAHQTERTDNLYGELVHRHPGRHGGETSLVGKIHQGRLHQVVAMMAERYLVASQFLSRVEKYLPAIPGTKKTGRATAVGIGKRCLYNMERCIMFVGKVRKKALVVLIRDIRHAHVGSNNREPRTEYARTARQEFEQRHGILTARKTDQNTVTILDERIALQSLFEKFL